MYIWYDDRFSQMKRPNAHEVTLWAVLGMLFMYLCPHLVRRQTAESHRWASHASVCMCAVNETAQSVSFINRDAEHAGFIFK